MLVSSIFEWDMEGTASRDYLAIIQRPSALCDLSPEDIDPFYGRISEFLRPATTTNKIDRRKN
jgi:hypothetical protein